MAELMPQRIWDKIHFNLVSGCWEWTASCNQAGYGQISLGDRRVMGAHRAVYQLLVGPIPEGLQLDHFACDNPPCVNPNHLRPVTPRENSLRSSGLASQMLARRECPRGHPYDETNTYNRPGRGRECRICNKAQHKAKLEDMAARLAVDPTLAPHGRVSTYISWKCRCQPCRDAQMARQRAYRAVRGRPNG